MPMPELPEDLSQLSLSEIAKMVADQRLPPVETWTPERTGHSEMRIARDGSWFHQDGLIRRETMVRLFSSLLRRDDDGRHFLVTPAEKLEIDVEDTAFIAVEAKSEGTGKTRTIALRLNTGDLVVAGPAHALRFTQENGAPRPILHVRAGLEARLSRPAFYALAEWAIDEANAPIGLWSNGAFFAMEAA